MWAPGCFCLLTLCPLQASSCPPSLNCGANGGWTGRGPHVLRGDRVHRRQCPHPVQPCPPQACFSRPPLSPHPSPASAQPLPPKSTWRGSEPHRSSVCARGTAGGCISLEVSPTAPQSTALHPSHRPHTCEGPPEGRALGLHLHCSRKAPPSRSGHPLGCSLGEGPTGFPLLQSLQSFLPQARPRLLGQDTQSSTPLSEPGLWNSLP